MPKSVDEIAGEIMNDMEKLLLERVYIAILKEGEVLYASTSLDHQLKLLKLFCITEFKQMKDFDHSFPLAGTNLAIFKINEFLIALYTKKGYQGQLLSFKTKMFNYLDDLKSMADVPSTILSETETKGQVLPKLIQTVSLTLGLSDDESSVLKLCDGNHSIPEIIVKTRLPRKKVVNIVRYFENKGWLKLETKGEVELIPLSIKKFPETAVRLGLISKKNYDINELCDGKNTSRDIAEKLRMSEEEITKILEKMENNSIIKMTIKIPEEGPLVSEPVETKTTEIGEIDYPEINVKPILTANVSFTIGFDEREKRILSLLDGFHTIQDIYNVTQIPFLEIFKIIVRYEEKGWIHIPIDEFMHIVSIKDKLRSEYQVMQLKEKYRKIMNEVAVTSGNGPTLKKEREFLLKKIKDKLPLMPQETQNKLVDKLIKISARSRDHMLEKLILSESSKKFKKNETQEMHPASSIPSKLIPKQDIQKKLRKKPIIDESPLLRPSEIFGKEYLPKLTSTPQSEPSLLSTAPQITVPIGNNLGEYNQLAKPEKYLTKEIVSKELSGDQDQISEVLEFLNSLLGIPEIVYLSLID